QAMLTTANYEARKYGVRSAMPGFIAKKLCPQLVIVPNNFEKYSAVAQQIRTVFGRYDPHFSPMSLDEAYLNITKYCTEHDMEPEDVVQRIRDEIFAETQLTASAGIAANKLLVRTSFQRHQLAVAYPPLCTSLLLSGQNMFRYKQAERAVFAAERSY